MTIRYVDEVLGPYTLHRREVGRQGGVLQLLPGQSQDGYGDKITTDIVIKVKGEARERRVYCVCHSNVGSHYILCKEGRLYLRTHFQDEILD